MANPPLHLLALETSSSVCGVALLSVTPDGISLQSLAHDATGEHAERLLPMAGQLLQQAGLTAADLTAVAFGQGPGGFTGLRVACGVAQGMAYALGLPVLPVVSLHAAAQLDEGDEPVRVVFQDARMGEVYAAAYQRDGETLADEPGWSQLEPPQLLAAADGPEWLAQMIRTHGLSGMAVRVLGDALPLYPQLLPSAPLAGHADTGLLRRGAPLRATAQAVARLALRDYLQGRSVPPQAAAPLYVRDRVAYTSAERAQGMGGNPKAPAALSIRPMTVDDISVVADIERSVQAFPWTAGNFRDALQAGYSGWLAVRQQEIVGFYLVMYAPDVAHLLLLAVTPQAQRQGVGHQLLRHCEVQAGTQGLPAVLLEVRPSNLRAVNFYQNRGYVKLAVRKDYYPLDRNSREDAWVMQKALAAQTAGVETGAS